MSNVNERLENLYGTSLEIESRPGEGTRVSFIIPREQAGDYEGHDK